MPAKVILRVTQGKLHGEEYVFDERTTCLVGRAEDCQVRLPSDSDHRHISRHHCLLDINPPDVRIRDFGSRNGTFVNGTKIGQRLRHQSASDVSGSPFLEHDLRDGDEISLGKTVFRVGIMRPAACPRCGAEFEDDSGAVGRGAAGPCAACREEGRPATEPLPGLGPQCARCGRDVSDEEGARRAGAFVCSARQAEPLGLVKRLLEQADAGHAALAAVRGYEVLGELGQGGMGVVFRARHRRTGEQVAFKLLLPRVAVDDLARKRFLREADSTGTLKHPHVVALRAAGCGDGVFFLVLEYCDGGSVEDLLRRRGAPLEVDEALPVVLQALDGLDYAHNADIPYVRRPDGSFGPGRGLVHRDIKPHNLFLAGTGAGRMTKVGDYGLAKAFDSAGLSGYTRTGAASGTPLFMPRQQLINFKYARPEVDVWAMAATLYYLLTGTTPRVFSRQTDWCRVVLETQAVPIRQRVAALPQGLADVIDTALIDRPAIPFQTAAELKHALEVAWGRQG
jgi:serine/threonine-protein kinase